MNELEKQTAASAVSPSGDATASDTTTAQAAVNTDKTEEKCETECAIESSPSLDIAEAADHLESERDKTHGFHAMSKEELIEALKDIVDNGKVESHKEVAAIKQAFYNIEKKQHEEELKAFVEAGNPEENFVSAPNPDEETMRTLLADFKEKRNAFLEEKEAEKKENLDKKLKIIDELLSISEDIDNINLHFQKFQQLQQDFKGIGDVPASDDADIWKKYQQAVERFYDHLKVNKELRDLHFKKNLELKTLLIEKAAELTELEDPIEAFRSLQTLHAQWREIGPVDREIREEIWGKFKDYTTTINKRHQDFFESRKASEQANEDAKTALCEKAEAIDLTALKNFTDWDNATKQVLELQQEWKSLGFASRKMNNLLFTRFRKTCDDFFTSKAEFFKKTKEESRENLAKKEALCEKAEKLLERHEEKEAFDEIQALQKEWRTIGVVRRRQGDEVWKRFCAAVDAFYDARRKLFSGKREEENANLESKKAVISRLKEISEDAERKEVIAEIRELQDQWQQIGHVPYRQKDAINSEYRAELDRLFNAFDLKENRQRMRRFEGELKKMEGDDNKISRERDRLVRAIEAREAEMKTIENNLGFFNVKSSAGNTMLRDFERKIAKLKEEIAQIKEKIKLIDRKGKEEPAATQPETPAQEEPKAATEETPAEPAEKEAE